MLLKLCRYNKFFPFVYYATKIKKSSDVKIKKEQIYFCFFMKKILIVFLLFQFAWEIQNLQWGVCKSGLLESLLYFLFLPLWWVTGLTLFLFVGVKFIEYYYSGISACWQICYEFWKPVFLSQIRNRLFDGGYCF